MQASKSVQRVHNLLHGGRGIDYNDGNDMEKLIITRIIKTGNSLCVVLPKNVLHALKLERGDQVVFGIYDENSLVIRKVSQSELLAIKPPQI